MSEEKKGARSASVVLAGRALVMLGGALSILTLAGFANALWWPFEMACHFRMQYLVLLVVVGVALALLRRPRAAIAFAAFCVMNVALVAPLYLAPASTSASVSLRAMLINLRTSNREADKVKAAVKQYNPDFLVLLETDRWWLTALGSLSETYPHAVRRPRPDNFGITFFSKVPLTKAEIVDLGPAGVPSVFAEAEFEGRSFAILGAHALPPIRPRGVRWRNEQFADTAAFVRELHTPVLLLGDLNATPWSHAFSKLLDDAGLRDSAAGRGYQPTWPAANPLLRIPIDHCLHSSGIEVVDRQVGPDVGSDHFPLIVDFTLP